MKIAGVSMVRNEIDVIEFCIEHHLSQGLDYIFICDNGSTDGTLEYLRIKAKIDERVVLYEDPGQYHQQQIINHLSKLAYDNGCTWIVPFDADELWLSENTLKNDLLKIQTSSVRVRLKDFVQSSEVLMPKSGTYASIKWRLPDNQPLISPNDIIDGYKSMIESPSLYKYIIKTSENLNIFPGAHGFSGQDTSFYEGSEFKAYHIPIRSYQALISKAEQGQRLIDAGYPETHGWHVQRYARLYREGLLLDEWKRNSENDGILTRKNLTTKNLYFDESVSQIYSNYLKDAGIGKITAIIRTIGRDTLLHSILSAQSEFDNVIVVADNIDIDLSNLPENVLYLKNTNKIDSYGGAAINLAASKCTTEYLCLLDDDDEYVFGAGSYMKEKIQEQPDIDIWIPGLRYNDGLLVCMEYGLKEGNVAVPTYKTKVLQAYPFVENMGSNAGLTDFYHVANIASNGYKIGWYEKHLYNVRPNLPGRLGRGLK